MRECELGVIETWLSTHFVGTIGKNFFSRARREKLAARLGLEPRQNESESFVLPLHHRAVKSFLGAHSRVGRVGPRPRQLAGCFGAGDGIRTRNRLFTKQVLYH